MLLQMSALNSLRPVDGFPSEELKEVANSMASAIGILTLLRFVPFSFDLFELINKSFRATSLLLKDRIFLLPKDLTTLHGISPSMALREPAKLSGVVREMCQVIL